MSALFSLDDLAARLGARVTPEARRSSTALAAFQGDLVLRGLGTEADRVASLGSENPERARRGWARRRVNFKDASGNDTGIPRPFKVRFTGIPRAGVDVGISVSGEVSGLGYIEISPRYVLGIPYIRLEKGMYVGTRDFVGFLYEPTGKGKPYSFLCLDLLDPVFLTGWNHLVGHEPKFSSFPKVEHLDTHVGRTVHITIRPTAQDPRTYDREKVFWVKGERKTKSYKVEEVHHGTHLGKTLVRMNRSQAIPQELLERNIQKVIDGKPLGSLETLEVQAFEMDGSIRILVTGSKDSLFEIDEIQESVTPFDALDIPPERFSPMRAEKYVKEWLGRPLNEDHVLLQRALQYGIVNEAQEHSAILATLRTFFMDQITRASALVDELFDKCMGVFEKRELPAIEACLAGRTLAETLEGFTPEDVTAAWITSQLETGDRYRHEFPFFRKLRQLVLRATAKKAGYKDPEPVKPEPEAPKADALAETEAPKAEGANGDASKAEVSAEPVQAKKPKRKSRKAKADPADTTAS